MDAYVLFGLPLERERDEEVLSSFFNEKGWHIVCGGSTALRVAAFLQKDCAVLLPYESDLPPIGQIEGVDLVTEGKITVSAAVRYMQEGIPTKKDGAVRLSWFLQKAENIYFFVREGERTQTVKQLATFFPNLFIRLI